MDRNQNSKEVTPFLTSRWERRELSIGRNLIGRNGKKTDVIISASGESVGHRLAIIAVTRMLDGSLVSTIENLEDDGILVVDGNPLAKGNQAILGPGTKIVIGRTKFVYKEKQVKRGVANQEPPSKETASADAGTIPSEDNTRGWKILGVLIIAVIVVIAIIQLAGRCGNATDSNGYDSVKVDTIVETDHISY